MHFYYILSAKFLFYYHIKGGNMKYQKNKKSYENNFDKISSSSFSVSHSIKMFVNSVVDLDVGIKED